MNKSLKFGLNDHELAAIRAVIVSFPQVEQAILFGSRALRNNRPESDVDIVLRGNGVDHVTVVEISRSLNEETALPYHFDVLALSEITHSELLDHIHRVGKTIYSRKGQPARG